MYDIYVSHFLVCMPRTSCYRCSVTVLNCARSCHSQHNTLRSPKMSHLMGFSNAQRKFHEIMFDMSTDMTRVYIMFSKINAFLLLCISSYGNRAAEFLNFFAKTVAEKTTEGTRHSIEEDNVRCSVRFFSVRVWVFLSLGVLYFQH